MTRSLADIHRDSFIHRLDGRVKLVATMLFILALCLTGRFAWPPYAAYLLVLVMLVWASNLPVMYLLRRSLPALPVVIVVAVFMPFMKAGDVAAGWHIGQWQISITYQGLEAFGAVVVKAWLSMLALVLLTATTSLSGLLKAMQQLHLPNILVTTLSFMHRYVDLLEDEFTRMRQARDSRFFAGGWFWQMRTIGNMIGTLFIRSYERGERVYAAMLARGFAGQMPVARVPPPRISDLLFASGFTAYLVCVWLLLGRV